MKRDFIPPTDVMKKRMMNLENQFLLPCLAGRQFKQRIVRLELFNNGLIAVWARFTVQAGAAMGNVNLQTIGDDSSDLSRLAQQSGERAFNRQFANRNDWIGRLLSRDGNFLTKHHIFSYTSGEGKIYAVKATHLHLCGRCPFQPFGHSFPGKGPFHRHNPKKYYGAD